MSFASPAGPTPSVPARPEQAPLLFGLSLGGEEGGEGWEEEIVEEGGEGGMEGGCKVWAVTRRETQ